MGESPSWGGNLKCQPRRGKELLFLRTTISVSSSSHSLLSSLLSAPLRRFRSRWPLRTPSTLDARYGLTDYRRNCSPTSQHLCCPFTAHVGIYAHVGHTVQRVTQSPSSQTKDGKGVIGFLISATVLPSHPLLSLALHPTPTAATLFLLQADSLTVVLFDALDSSPSSWVPAVEQQLQSWLHLHTITVTVPLTPSELRSSKRRSCRAAALLVETLQSQQQQGTDVQQLVLVAQGFGGHLLKVRTLA